MKTNARILLLGVITACLSILGVARAQTVVWSENFDDGNADSRWYADTGVWLIGTPTIGPATNSAGYRTHSGPYCATTGLTANYPVGMNSRLIQIQTFTVPAAKLFPRLRFWHWYAFASAYYGNDYGVVEIKVGGNAWQAVSPQYIGNSGDWTCASVDLSAFAGQTVQLAFHSVYINGQSAVGPGWYVDDVSLITGTPVLNNLEGFEVGFGDWYAEPGIWQVGSPTKSGGPATNSLGSQAYAGTNCAVTVLNNNYPAGMNSRLISPPFVLPHGGFLRFRHWYSFASAYYGNDYGVVEIKVGTNAWQEVSPHYIGNGASWTQPYIDLTSFGGQTVQLAFHAVYANGQGASGPGWYVDNVQVFPDTSSAANPYVNIARSGTNVVINWTSLPEYTGFILQSTTNFNTLTNWITSSPTPVVVNGQSTATNPIVAGTQKYFRLKQ